MKALSLIRRPAAPDTYTQTHTYMLTFMRKHTLHINPLNLCPPSSNHFSLFSTKNFLLNPLYPNNKSKKSHIAHQNHRKIQVCSSPSLEHSENLELWVSEFAFPIIIIIFFFFFIFFFIIIIMHCSIGTPNMNGSEGVTVRWGGGGGERRAGSDKMTQWRFGSQKTQKQLN